MSEKPLISVCTPVYNGEDFLEECIKGVLAVVVQRKFAPMIGQQLTVRCQCKLPSSQRKYFKTPT